MNFTLLDNGVDSLKSSLENLEALNDVLEGGEHRLKDAVIYLNHGIELLLKYILKQHSPALMFEKVDAYKEANKKLKKSPKEFETVFDINDQLRTVSLIEALTRIEYLCDIDVPESLGATIRYLSKVRNKFMHFEIHLDKDETETLVRNLQACYKESLGFLEFHVPDIKKYIQDARFELTYEEYEKQQLAIYDELYYDIQREDAYIDYVEGAYEDLGEGR